MPMTAPVVICTVAPAKAVDRLAKLEAAVKCWLAAKDAKARGVTTYSTRWSLTSNQQVALDNLEKVAREVREGG